MCATNRLHTIFKRQTLTWAGRVGADRSFTGSYNGNGYKITNINAPLFGTTITPSCKKIGLTNARVTNGSGVLADNCFGGTC